MNVPVDTPMADVNAWGWQGSTKAIKDRTAYMLDHSPIPFNVKFEVRRPGKEAVLIEAHKDILAIGSEVFLTMFYGGLIDNDRIIDIPDTDSRAFSIMIRFLYTEKLSTALIEKDIRVALEVMKCAGKYGVPYLYIQCRQWILEHFVEHFNSRKNVETDGLPYLRLALKVEFEDVKILEAMWNVIDVCAESVLQTPDEILRYVRLDLLTLFLARDSLTVLKEKHLYEFMIRWVKLQTSEYDSPEVSLRERLGDAFKKIRYTQMDLSEFSNGPAAGNVLTSEETIQVYRHQFVPVVEGEFPFISRPRKKTATPMLLAVVTAFFHGKSHLSSICDSVPFANVTVEIGELHPLLMRFVESLLVPRLNNVSAASWSCIENSTLTTFTVRFNHTNDAGCRCVIDLDHGNRQELLKEMAGQVVDLGFGDVAMEVMYEERIQRTGGKKICRINSLSLIFGGYASSTYASVDKTSSVFYLGRIVRGTTDFSFLRRFTKPGKLFPTFECLGISTKFAKKTEDGDEEEE